MHLDQLETFLVGTFRLGRLTSIVQSEWLSAVIRAAQVDVKKG